MNSSVKNPPRIDYRETSTSPTDRENPPLYRRKPYRIPNVEWHLPWLCLEEYMGRSQQNSRHTINTSYNQCHTVTVSSRHNGTVAKAQ